IPAEHLLNMLSGKVRSLSISQVKLENGSAEIRAEVQLIDPARDMKSVALHFVRADFVKDKLSADKEGCFPMLPGSEKVALTLDGPTAAGNFKVAADVKESVAYTCQTVFVKSDGKSVYGEPLQFKVDFGNPSFVPRTLAEAVVTPPFAAP